MEELYLIAAIAGRPVAMPSSQIDSVVDLGPVVPIPRAPCHVRGLAALRSKVVTVIDAALALGEEPQCEANKRAVIVSVGGHIYALLVDRLEDVAPFTPARLADGVGLERGWAAVARGVVDRDGDTVLVIDPVVLIEGSASSHEKLAA